MINLPKGSTQTVILDVTGRSFSMETITKAVTRAGECLKDICPNIPIEVVGALGI